MSVVIHPKDWPDLYRLQRLALGIVGRGDIGFADRIGEPPAMVVPDHVATAILQHDHPELKTFPVVDTTVAPGAVGGVIPTDGTNILVGDDGAKLLAAPGVIGLASAVEIGTPTLTQGPAPAVAEAVKDAPAAKSTAKNGGKGGARRGGD